MAARSYIHTPHKGEYLYQTIPDRIKYFAEKTPNKEVFVFLSPGKQRTAITCAELYEKSVKFARGLLHIGTRRNDIVAIIIPNSVEWVICTFGCLLAGATPLHALFLKSDGEDVVSLLKSVGNCVTLILDPREDMRNLKIAKNFIDELKSDGTVVSQLLPTLKHVIFTRDLNNDALTLEKVIQSADSVENIELPKIDPDDGAAILTTSGSSGTPKAVLHSHFGLILGGVHMSEGCNIREDDVYFNDRTFSWIGGYPEVFLAKGNKIVTFEECSLTDFTEITNFFVKVIEQEKCNVALIIPPVMMELMKSPPNCQTFPLKGALVGGMPVPEAYTGILGSVAKSLTNIYGCTEIGLASSYRVEQKSDFTENYIAGFPGSGREIKIVDENGSIVPQNSLGEIWIRGPGLFIGYKNSDSEIKTSTGWLKTGDMGLINDNGLLLCKGRKSDVIHYGIRNVFPVPMEAALRKCRGVQDVVIVPIPDEMLYNQLCACIVKENGSNLTVTEVRKYFEDQLAIDYLWGDTPGYFLFFENFPRTATGKVIRKEVEKMARTLLAF